MDEDSRTVKVFQAVQAITQRLVRRLGIGRLSIIASLVLADRVNATYLNVDCARAPIYAECYNAGDYLDKGWYYLLDDGQYYYLDRGQYNLLGELGYLLGVGYIYPYADRKAELTFAKSIVYVIL
ncbi:MAG TPA: hypothetical protein VMW72_19270 [Sedimentisphaerales bacterium]|nr:hypothetical protein [Sedimentisphaerales bacterium]